VSQYQKGKSNLDFTEARDSEWQWHQLGHMQVCTSLQTENHASTPALSFLQAGWHSCRPTNSVKEQQKHKELSLYLITRKYRALSSAARCTTYSTRSTLSPSRARVFQLERVAEEEWREGDRSRWRTCIGVTSRSTVAVHSGSGCESSSPVCRRTLTSRYAQLSLTQPHDLP